MYACLEVRPIHPEIVGWSTAPRGQVINESLGQVPKKLAAGPRVLARTEASPTQSGTKQGGPPHDHWAKLGRLRYTRTQYSPVMIALFSMNFIAPPSRKKSAARTGLSCCRESWRRLDGHSQLPKIILGVRFTDGIEVVRPQAQIAAA
jgi:hypothetical protein